jgi:hypothetical protein
MLKENDHNEALLVTSRPYCDAKNPSSIGASALSALNKYESDEDEEVEGSINSGPNALAASRDGTKPYDKPGIVKRKEVNSLATVEIPVSLKCDSLSQGVKQSIHENSTTMPLKKHLPKHMVPQIRMGYVKFRDSFFICTLRQVK